MKTELLEFAQSNYANATANLTLAEKMLARAQMLPDDVPSTPTGLCVLRTYGGTESPLALELKWDPLDAGAAPILDVKGAPGNPNGPQEWTEIPVNGVPGPNGELATYVIQQHCAQTVNLRLRARFSVSGATSEGLILPFTTTVN